MNARILVCTDGGPGALGALRVANALAERDDRPVDVLAVVQPVYMEGITLYAVPGDYVAAGSTWVEDFRANVRAQLRDVGGRVGAVEPHVEIGQVAHTIATVANARAASLIVMGAGGHGRAERWTGSETSLYVSRMARVPVLAVPAGQQGLPASAVVAVDFSEYSRDAALSAARLLGPAGRLRLVHATWLRPGQSGVGGDWMDTYRSGAESRLEKLAREIREQAPVGPVETAVVAGDPAEAVLQAAREMGAELVAAGSHGSGFFTRVLLGSTSTRLLRRAGGAVLIAPPRAASAELAEAREKREQAVPQGSLAEPALVM